MHGQTLPVSERPYLDEALSATLRVFPSEYEDGADDEEPESGAPNRHATHESVVPLRPARPETLSKNQTYAAEAFDEVHRQRTEKANETLRSLAERSPEDKLLASLREPLADG